MVHFVGAGSGAVDLTTVRGARLLQQADVIIYAGSLVNKQLLEMAKEGCQLYDSAQMTLEQVIDVIAAAEAAGKTTVRLHTGDPSIYGAVREQFDQLLSRGIAYDVCPGVSSFCGAAAALKTEYTLPDVSQTVDHHPGGRPYTGAGAGVHPCFGSPSGYHGPVFKHLAYKDPAAGAAGRGLSRHDPRCGGV